MPVLPLRSLQRLFSARIWLHVLHSYYCMLFWILSYGRIGRMWPLSEALLPTYMCHSSEKSCCPQLQQQRLHTQAARTQHVRVRGGFTAMDSLAVAWRGPQAGAGACTPTAPTRVKINELSVVSPSVPDATIWHSARVSFGSMARLLLPGGPPPAGAAVCNPKAPPGVKINELSLAGLSMPGSACPGLFLRCRRQHGSAGLEDGYG